jgi:hypothetical protein
MKKTDARGGGGLMDRLSNPIPYFRAGSTKAEFWACGNCGHVRVTERDARHCYPCAPKACGNSSCDERIAPGSAYIYCDPCREVERLARLERRVLAAPRKILFEDYEHDCFMDSGGDYHYSIDDLHPLDHGPDYPRFVWGCIPKRFQLDFGTIMENALEAIDVDHYGLFPTNGESALGAAIDAFNAEQPECAWYEEDPGTVIFLPWPDPKEWGFDETPEDWPESWDAVRVMRGEAPCLGPPNPERS